MPDRFHYLGEPVVRFAGGQCTEDPHDGLALFGAYDARPGLAPHVVIGTQNGLRLWTGWSDAMNAPAACVDVGRHRPWPPFPGFDVCFGGPWPDPAREYVLDSSALSHDAQLADRHDRTYAVVNQYLQHAQAIAQLDETPAVVICIVPDDVYRYCRPQQNVPAPTDNRRTDEERKYLHGALKERESGQTRMFEEDDPYQASDPSLERFEMSPDFRRQLKARMMQEGLPVQIIKESTLDIDQQVRDGLPGVNPLSDRLWNFSVGIFYKCGRKPWQLNDPRQGVCYVGLAYKRADQGNTACCAAQLFMDSGDGLVFVGDFGPWYSKEKNEFHLDKASATDLLAGALRTYEAQEGRPLQEIFVHARSGLNEVEFAGFQAACPKGVKLVGIRVRKDRLGPRLFRHDNHPNNARQGMYPVLRGILWERSPRYGLLFTTGFKQRLAAYDGWELPVPLDIRIQHGEASIDQVAKDILALTKVNYNACQLGESEPITVKYSDRVGEVLLSNPNLPKERWHHNFKFYV